MMTNDLKEPGKLLYASWKINLDEVPIEQLDHYIAVENHLIDGDELLPDAENLEKVRGYLEAFYHLCQVEDWRRAKAILDCHLNTPTNEEFHLQMGTWGYYQEQNQLYDTFLNNLENLHPFYKIAFFQEKGNIEYAKGNYIQSINYYEQAISCLDILPNSHPKGIILGSIGLAYLYLGKYSEAKSHLWQRLLIAWENKELEQEGIALSNLGLVYHETKEYNKSIKYQERSRSILRMTKNKLAEGSVLNSLGSNYAALGQYSKALKYQQQHLAISQESEDRRGEAEAFCNVAITLTLLTRYSEALEYFNKSIEICRTIGSRGIEAYALNNLAKVYLILGDRSLAFEFCDRALSIANELGIALAQECQDLKAKLLMYKKK